MIIRSLAAVPSTKWASGIRTKIHVVLEGLMVCNVWKPMFYGKPYWYSFCFNSRIITPIAAIRFANDKYLRRISDPVLKFPKKIFSMQYLHLGYCIFNIFVWMKWPCWTYKMWYIYFLVWLFEIWLPKFENTQQILLHMRSPDYLLLEADTCIGHCPR